MNRYHYKFPIGTVCIEEENHFITGLYMDSNIEENEKETELLQEAYQQLKEYFSGNRKTFDLPIHLEGTEFQKKVWAALQTIPYGATRTYGEIAEQIGKHKASRAVGGANHNNPIMIIVPCHRVIGVNGSLVGFGGGLDMKKYLLELEKRKN
ncbi:methylated-DNA--[protein]-cysteine S-methyltransferase [Roseburia sp. 499]|uniref:methylated-DNA--[protein]-cysteine S-methyltransferase n=1 Tax=Roseburia sp. 499 TaxID=1261634 RepID=UPI0009510AC6|nr:methylated-DNA--[protein]-cysteine S-methyltransferase [Roseburia sp. 499]WVK70537.1 methylated-DNA--[protein]-cysteine S-methyltransferase [Roseburia sp. 499]